LSVGLDEVIAEIPEFQLQHGQQWIVVFSDYYLSQRIVKTLQVPAQ
jgi:hypothetical protein